MEQWLTGRLLSTAARLVERTWNEQLVEVGVTHAGVIALGVLKSQGSITQARLAQLVRVQAQTMGKTLSRLEAHGHVVRVRSEIDRRSQLVTITDAGSTALKQAQEIERRLMPDGELVSEALRSQLKSVIRELGDPRWPWQEATPDQLDEEALTDPEDALADHPANRS